MKKILMVCILALIFSGCVSLQKADLPEDSLEAEEIVTDQEETAEKVSPILDLSPELQNIKGEELEGYVQKKGVVFSKTDFQGLLETRYVKFLFEDTEDPMHKFQLHIGENSDQQTFPWDVKTVKPGYFFVELPVGRYKISSVSIPVGSTMATEKMNVTLEVVPNTICYAGTLKMVGTKEKIKLGGLPVIKPGFEYTVEVLDEREEGAEAFRLNYPNFLHDISVKLMQVNVVSPENI
ncbi:MAG: hypothetical protein KAS92_00920 [Candidatus Omnitrophica bacterium]|nr:hypothetical protein [Candidatus Omnitrophota bacterium]